MKIAVATIALNEEQFVKRWAESCIDADYRLILDTGSTDDTSTKAIEVDVHWESKVFTPWRFDHARNHALSLIPDDIDYIIWLDMDEVLQPGWRAILETIPSGTTRPRYKYVWSWNGDGSEGLVYGGDKIHARHGYVWKHPVHEVITPLGSEIHNWMDGFEIHHHPDSSKSRSQYFDLLKLAIEEEPNDERNQYYLGREYFYHNDVENAVKHLNEHLRLSRWLPERASSYRMIYKMTRDVKNLYLALSEDPVRRENLVALAIYHYENKNWQACYQFASNALRFTEKPLDYLCEAESWGFIPHDLAAISAWNLGDKESAKTHGKNAIEQNPNDERLKNNLEWYSK